MMKKIISLSILCIFLFNMTVFADNTPLKLDEVIQKAVIDSSKLRIDDLNIKSANKAYDVAVDDANGMVVYSISKKTFKDSGAEGLAVLEDDKTKNLLPEQRKYEKELAAKQKQVDEKNLIIDVYDTYYELLKTNKDIEIKSDELKSAKIKLKNTADKYALGLVSKNDYKIEQLNKNSVLAKLNGANRVKKRLSLKLYNLMNLGYNPDIRPLDDTLTYKDMKDVDVEAALKAAFENRLEVFKANREFELKEKEFDILKEYYDEEDTAYIDAEIEVQEAEFNIDTVKQDIEFEIRSAYNDLLNQLETIDTSKADVEKAQMNYDVVKLKSGLGMATEIEVQEAKIMLDKSKLDLINNTIGYIIERHKFDVAQGI